MVLSAPFPALPSHLLRCSKGEKRDDSKIKSLGSEGFKQAIYYGGIAAFVGKTFFNMNGYHAAAYGIARGALDQFSGNFVFDHIIGGDEKLKDLSKPLIYLTIALDSIVSMVLVGIVFKAGEMLKNGASYVSGKRIDPVTNGLSIGRAVSMELGFTASGLVLLGIYKFEGKLK